MQKGLRTFGAIVIGVAVYFVVQKAGIELSGNTNDVRSAKFLSGIASEFNKNLPMQVDSETQLISTMGTEGTFTYVYRLINLTREEIDTESFVVDMQSHITNYACNDPEMRAKFLNEEIELEYKYLDMESIPIEVIPVTLSDCK